eukprot:c57404_g1_i1 orf=32-193(+)
MLIFGLLDLDTKTSYMPILHGGISYISLSPPFKTSNENYLLLTLFTLVENPKI